MLQPRSSGEIDHDPRQGLVQGYVGMAIASYALLVAHGLAEGLTEGDAEVFDRMVGIDVQIATGLDIQVHEPMTRHLIEHVLEKRDPRVEPALPGPVQVDGRPNLGFEGVAADLCRTWAHHVMKR